MSKGTYSGFLVGPPMVQQNLSLSNPSPTSIHIIDNLELLSWNITIYEEKSTRLSSILLMIPSFTSTSWQKSSCNKWQLKKVGQAAK